MGTRNNTDHSMKVPWSLQDSATEHIWEIRPNYFLLGVVVEMKSEKTRHDPSFGTYIIKILSYNIFH